MRHILTWGALALATGLPLLLSLQSPLLAYREPVYILAGATGVAALGLILVQPLLAGGLLPLTPPTSRRLHRIIGASLLLLVLAHVAALWITSPPDVIDALLLRSPTPFSLWGVIALWAVVLSALSVRVQKRLRAWLWRRLHRLLAVLIVSGTIAHALLIEGTMEPLSKAALCLAAALATLFALTSRHPWRRPRK
ncbi:MAG: ferric reductase-like transmembrane domain-containing protein [Pseudomonadota bacterium]